MKRRRYKGVLVRLGPNRGRFADTLYPESERPDGAMDVLWAHTVNKASYLIVHPGAPGRPYRERQVEARRIGGELVTTSADYMRGGEA